MPILLLPLIEIAGFVAIGGRMGVFLTMLWLAGATMAGIYLLRLGGSRAWGRARNGNDEFFAIQDAFDSLCLLIAALLLIFPGFISDFIAIPFLISPFRHWLFGHTKRHPDNFVRRSYTTWTATRPGAKGETVIEGEFRRIEEPGREE
jgi:UPF0716 protein FxsA